MQNVRTTYIFTRVKRQLFLIEKLAFLALAISVSGSLFWLFQLHLLNLDKLKLMFSFHRVDSWLPLVFGMLLVLVQSVMQWSYRSARLIVDAEGLRLEQTSNSWLARLSFYKRDVRWADLKNATFVPLFGIVQLRSSAERFPWVIRSKDWQLNDGGVVPAVDKNAENALVRLFREHGVFDSFPNDSNLDAMTFDLTKHPATKAFLVVMAAMLIYTFVDIMLQNESWVFFNRAYVIPHVLAGVFACLMLIMILYQASRQRKVPMRVIIGLAMLGGAMFAGTSYVGGIRINQALGGPMLEASYHRNKFCNTLVPEDKSLPVIEYTNLAIPYWCSKGADELITVKVRKGLLGLYQVDLSEHRNAIRDYRQSH